MGNLENVDLPQDPEGVRDFVSEEPAAGPPAEADL